MAVRRSIFALCALLSARPVATFVGQQRRLGPSRAARHVRLFDGALGDNEMARRMAEEALLRSNADIAVAITGVAGPGGSEHKPAGLVHFALARRDGATIAEVHRFGDRGRDAVRLASVATALDLLSQGVDFFG